MTDRQTDRQTQRLSIAHSKKKIFFSFSNQILYCCAKRRPAISKSIIFMHIKFIETFWCRNGLFFPFFVSFCCSTIYFIFMMIITCRPIRVWNHLLRERISQSGKVLENSRATKNATTAAGLTGLQKWTKRGWKKLSRRLWLGKHVESTAAAAVELG